MDHRHKVGGYVKLAKLWERSKDAAVAYHSSYYAEKFRDDADKKLVGVYIDITGNKEIQALLEANELAVGKDHQFKGRYEAEKNAVIISLEKDEREW